MSNSTAPLRDLSVLVIEDNAFTSQLVASILRKIGVGTVFEAATALNAFKILSTTSVGLIICDLEMEPMSGLTFIQKLRAGQPPEAMALKRPIDSATPVIVLTAHTSADIVTRAHQAGATAFLSKPINPNLIKQRIEAVVAKAEQPDNGLYRVIYFSRLSSSFAKQDIKTILSSSQQRNPARGISGALCFNNTHFLQIMEAPRRTLEALYAKIAADPRHHDVKTITRESIDARTTEGWSMMFLGGDAAMTDLYRRHCGGDRFAPDGMNAVQAMGFMTDVVARYRQG